MCKNVSFGRNLFLVDEKNLAEHVYDCFTIGGTAGGVTNHFYGVMG